MCVLLFDTFNEINRLIWKRMSNIYYLKKTDVLKSLIFLERKFEEMH